MHDEIITRAELVVPVNCGYLIGNTLRQFAMRGSPSWQIAAYNLPNREGTFGFGDGNMFSYLDLLNGRLVCADDTLDGTVTTKFFTRKDDLYVADGLHIEGLENLNASGLECCLVKASGSRTSKMNHAVAKEYFGDTCVSVPSKHTRAITFKFDVKPHDLYHEVLIIDATENCVAEARKAAVNLLSGLQI